MNRLGDWAGFEDVSVLESSSDPFLVHAHATWNDRAVSVLVAKESNTSKELRESDEALRLLQGTGAHVISVLTSYEDDRGHFWSVRDHFEGDRLLEDVHIVPRRSDDGLRPFSSDESRVFVQHAVQIAQIATRISNAGLSARRLDALSFVIRRTEAFPESGEPFLSLLPARAIDLADGVEACGRLLCYLVTGSRDMPPTDMSPAFEEAQEFADTCEVDLEVDLPDILLKAIEPTPRHRYASTLSLAIDLLALRDPQRDLEWAPGRLDELSRFKLGGARIWGRDTIIERIRAIVKQPRETIPGNGFRQICLVGEAGVGKSAILQAAVARMQDEAAAYLHKYEQGVTNPELDMPIKAFNYLFRYVLTRKPDLKDEICQRMRDTLDKSILDAIRGYLAADVQVAFFEEPAASNIAADKLAEIIRTGIFGIANVLLDLIRPFAIILDDVQWMPAEDRALINWGTMYSDCNLIGAVASRSDAELTPGASTIPDEMANLVARIDVRKLDRPAIMQWVQAVLLGDVKEPDAFDERTIAQVAEHLLLKADGNALLTSQELHQIYSSGALSFSWPYERWVVDTKKLLRVESYDLLHEHLTALDAPMLSFLQVVTVLSVTGTVSQDELVDATDRTGQEVQMLLDRSIKLGYLAEAAPLATELGPALRLVHDLVSQAVSETKCDWAALRLDIVLHLLSAERQNVRRSRLVVRIMRQAVDEGAKIPAAEVHNLVKVAYRAAQEASTMGASNVALECTNSAYSFAGDNDLWALDSAFAADLSNLHCSLLITNQKYDTAVRTASSYASWSSDLLKKLRANKWLVKAIAISDPAKAFEQIQGTLKDLLDIDLVAKSSESYGMLPARFADVQDLEHWEAKDDPATAELYLLFEEAMWAARVVDFDHARAAHDAALNHLLKHKIMNRESLKMLLICGAAQLTLHPLPNRAAIAACSEWARKQAEEKKDADLLLWCDLIYMGGSHAGDQSFAQVADALLTATLKAMSLCDYRVADSMLSTALLSSIFGSRPLTWIVDQRATIHQISLWLPMPATGLSVFSQFAANLRSDNSQSSSSTSLHEDALLKVALPLAAKLCRLEGPLHPVPLEEESSGPLSWHRSFLQTLMGLVLHCPEPASEALERLLPVRDVLFPNSLRLFLPFLEGLILLDRLRDGDEADPADLIKRVEADLAALEQVVSYNNGDYRTMHALLLACFASALPTVDPEGCRHLWKEASKLCHEQEQHLIMGLCCERYAAYAATVLHDETLAEQQKRLAQQAWKKWGATRLLDQQSDPVTPLTPSPL